MRIVLIGAYGYTGKLICELLQENKISFNIAGRKWASLEDLREEFALIDQIIQIDLVSDDLHDFLDNHDVLINCAGPFTEESDRFVQTLCEQENKTYIDITGELEFVRRSREIRHEIAQRNNSLVLHACAFESLIAGLGIQYLLGNEKPEEVNTFYVFEHSKPSPGTRMTMKLNKFRDNCFVKNGEWSEITENFTSPLLKDESKSALAYPLPEVAFVSWFDGVNESGSYLLLSKQEAMFAGITAKEEGDLKAELEKLKQKKRPGPSKDQRIAQESELVVETCVNGSKRALSLKGADMYGMTARCVVTVLHEILESKERMSGVIAPSQLFLGNEKRILDVLGISIEEIEPITQ